MSSNVIDVQSCQVKCCEDDLCNLPRHSQPSNPQGRLTASLLVPTIKYFDQARKIE